MNPTVTKALAVIEHHHVEHGVPTVMEMHDLREALIAYRDTGVDPETLAHDALTAQGWHVEMVDGVIYRLER
ncbi:hypothetical protein ACLBX9_12155 [Methylobacterium sp. A49B]